jgi:hypothetical protein
MAHFGPAHLVFIPYLRSRPTRHQRLRQSPCAAALLLCRPSGEGEPTGALSPSHLGPFLFIFHSSPSDNLWLQFAPSTIVGHPVSSLSSPIKGTHTFSALHRSIPLSSLISLLLVCHPQQGAPPTSGHRHRPVNSVTTLPPFAHSENPCVPLMLPKLSC